MLHAWELPGDYRIPSAALLFLVGPGGGGGICEPGFVAGIADTEPLHFAKYYSDPLPQTENEEEVPPTRLKKPRNLSVPSEEQVFTDLRKKLNFKRTRWTRPLKIKWIIIFKQTCHGTHNSSLCFHFPWKILSLILGKFGKGFHPTFPF